MWMEQKQKRIRTDIADCAAPKESSRETETVDKWHSSLDSYSTKQSPRRETIVFTAFALFLKKEMKEKQKAFVMDIKGKV